MRNISKDRNNKIPQFQSGQNHPISVQCPTRLFCVGQAIVQGDEGPVSGVAQRVEDSRVAGVLHEEKKEEEEIEQEVDGEKKEDAQTTMRMSMDGMTMEGRVRTA